MRVLLKKSPVLVALIPVALHAAAAALPEQFQVWGTAGPQLRPLPPDWTELRAQAPPGRPLAATPEEQRWGFVLFARDPLVTVDSGSVPDPAERVKELTCFATPGEYEPLTLGIYGLSDVSGLKITITGLMSSIGGVIPSEHVDVRVARSVPVIVDASAKTYRWEPFLLEKRPSLSIAKSNTALLWLTIKVPETAKDGIYTGKLQLTRSAAITAEVKLRLRVLPFILPPLPYETTLYYPGPAETAHMLIKELVDFREHGTSVPIPAMEVRIRSRDQKFGPDDVEETTLYSRRLLDGIKKVYGSPQFPVTFEAGHQIAFYWDQAKGWFSYLPHSPAIEADLEAAMRLMNEIAKSNGIPALRVYLSDEGAAHNLLDETIYYNRWAKEHFPEIPTIATIGGGLALGFDEIGQLGGVVDFLSANRFTPEIATALAARKKPFGVYNGAGATPASARFFFGFYGFKTGAQQVAQWSYSFGESPFTGNGLRLADEGYVYHAPDGPLPSVFWEAVREGIDDARYLELLRSKWRAAAEGERDAIRAGAARARHVLAQVLGKIGWGFQAMQSGDRTPPPHPSTLRKWRWQIAQQILALSVFDASLVVRDPERFSPLTFPWASARGDSSTFGPELLPASDFEAGFAPWRIEAWKGHGNGQLDAGAGHKGTRAVRISVPAEDGNGAVTVLVWPQYGDGKLNLELEAGRTYELSAWSKWRDRATQPELRINVPANVVTHTRTGQELPYGDGWQRIWVRVGLKSAAKPTYLAAWIQGPGTVWLDDLSLREVIPAPLDVSLDQEEYDSQDHLAVAALTVADSAKPAGIRCSLTRGDGETLVSGKVALAHLGQEALELGTFTFIPADSGGTCRFVFDPSQLMPGTYSLTLELVGTEGRVFARKALPLTRWPGDK